MHVDEFVASTPLVELFQERPAFVFLDADDVGRHTRADVQRLSPGNRMRPNQGLRDVWRTRRLFVIGWNTVSSVKKRVGLIGSDVVDLVLHLTPAYLSLSLLSCVVAFWYIVFYCILRTSRLIIRVV